MTDKPKVYIINGVKVNDYGRAKPGSRMYKRGYMCGQPSALIYRAISHALA